MRNFIRDFVRDDSGAAAAEYALILAIVGAGVAGAAFALGQAVSNSMGTAATTVSQAQGGGGSSGGGSGL